MGAGRYSAGAIFLQVVPVFRRVQDDIQREAEGWNRVLGDEMEKGGAKAGERAGKAAGRSMNQSMEEELKKGAADMEKALSGVDTKNLGKKLRSEVKEMRTELESLKNVDLKVDDNFDKVSAKVVALREQIEAMRKRSKVFFDIDGLPQVYRKLAQLETTLKGISDVNIGVDVDTRMAERKLGAFEKSVKRAMDKSMSHIAGSTKEVGKLRDELDYLSRLRVGVDIGANQLRKEVAEIAADLKRLSTDDPNIDVKVDAGRAWAELAALETALAKIDGQDVTVDVNVDDKGSMRRVASDGENAANSFRSFNAILFAAVGLGPALIPVLGGIAGGLLAIGPAAAVAGAGIGSVLVGFSGLGNAITALQARQDHQATTAQTAAKQNVAAGHAIRDATEAVANAERNAAQAAADAARRVADARRQAAESIKNALEQQASAQQSYAQSVKDVQDAEQALRDARQAAKGTGHSLKDQIKDNNLAIKQAQLDSFAATNNLNAVMADGSSTNAEQQQAKITRQQALQSLHELRDQQKQLAKDKKKWDKEGVNGTDAVQNAQDQLTSAIQAQKDAYQNLRDAAAAVDKARADGARNVADAIRAQNRTLADNKRSIQDAKQALVDARQSQDDLNTSINAQQQAVDAAFSKLGPAGRKFARFLFGLRGDFYQFRSDIQAAMLPSIQSAIEGFLGSKAGSAARKMMIDLAGNFGHLVQILSKSFQGKVWTRFFQMLADVGPKIQSAYGKAFIKFLEGMASVMTTLAPYALQFARGVQHLMNAFADWAKSKKGTDQIQTFMNYARKVAPDVIDFVKAFARAAVDLAKGLASWGDIVLGGVTAFLDFLANMDPKLLAAIVTSLVVLITASQAAYSVMNILMAGGALLTSTVGIWVFVILGVIAAIAFLYTQNKGFRDFIKKAWADISGAIHTAWDKYLKPALSDLMDSLNNLWHKVLEPLVKFLGPIIEFIVKVLLVWLVLELSFAAKAISWYIDNVILPAFTAIGKVMKWVWDHILKPVWNALVKAWHGLTKAMKWAWDNILHPVFKAIGKIVTVLWKATLKVIFLAITKGWHALVVAMKWAWEHILQPIWNAIKKAANFLWEHGLKQVFGWIGDKWHDMVTGMKIVWEKYLEPVWDYIKDKALPKLKGAFQTTVDAITKIWDGLKMAVGVPIKFVLDTIINHGLIDGFNKVANWVGEDGFDHIPIPKALQSYATGGIMPGYTPGRDVHKFVSPTAGRLELSGGEAIMRPEWTQAMGPGYVNQMNALARSQGAKGIQRAMGMVGGFWNGGVLPLLGGSISSHGSAYPFPAYDLNYPGYADYGKPIHAWNKGFARAFDFGQDESYGRGIVLDHGNAMTLYAHMSKIATDIVGKIVNAGTTIGYVGDYGNTGTPPTSHLHFEIRPEGWPGLPYTSDPSADFTGAYASGSATGQQHRSIPGFVKDLILHPISTVKGFVTDQWSKAKNVIGDVADSPLFGYAKRVPEQLVGGMAHKAYDFMPGWAKDTLGAAANFGGAVKDFASGVGHAAGAGLDAIGLANGGILPYNGTMKYDNGGYLAPGLTTVMNLTGKPEPVFTNDQWSAMGGGVGGGNIHYEPHFEGSDLTPEDVAADLNFAFRRIRRGGKYAGVGDQ